MNKSKTRTEYQRRVNLALEYIHESLDRNIQLDDVANVSYFSRYHFHRIFHALVGETVNDYVIRKRMEKAACRLLARPHLNITDVALMGGFSTSANFSKAFKLYFGISPSKIRTPMKQDKDSKIGKIYSKYGKVFNPQDLYSQFVTKVMVFDSDKLEEFLMKVKVEDLQEKSIVFLTAPKGYQLESVYETWDKIINWTKSNNVNDPMEQRFAICHDNPVITPEDKCRYDASVVIDSKIKVREPFKKSVIPAGKYAIAYYKDSGDKISNFMTEICSHWFPDSGYEPDDYPPVFHYLNDARLDGYVEMEIYIKIKELGSS